MPYKMPINASPWILKAAVNKVYTVMDPREPGLIVGQIMLTLERK